MVLNAYDLIADSRSYNFIMAPFWIQMHGILRKLMFADNIAKIAKNAGHLLELECIPANEILN